MYIGKLKLMSNITDSGLVDLQMVKFQKLSSCVVHIQAPRDISEANFHRHCSALLPAGHQAAQME